jgi:DNA-binding PadR family transcriptional regulator
MSKAIHLGEFEQIVLLALLRLGEEAYGMLVLREITETAGRDVSIGAVYATLDRMESKGLVESSVGDPTPERGGRAKRRFKLTALGISSLRQSHRAMLRMTHGLDPRLLA